jgi:NTE family protein
VRTQIAGEVLNAAERQNDPHTRRDVECHRCLNGYASGHSPRMQGRSLNQTNALDIARDGGRITLVLGAGGGKGFAYHAGVLAALEQHWSWSPNDATRIVGTSAGSMTGALIRRGLTPKDLCWTALGETDRYSEAALNLGIPPMIDVDLTLSWNSFRMPKPKDVWRLARLAMEGPVALGALGLLRDGKHDFENGLEFLGEQWPCDPVEIATVRADTGKRVILNRSSNVSFRTAVAASCAVPSIMRPVKIFDSPHVDGAVASPTNADVAISEEHSIDGVIIVSPMSGSSAKTCVGRAAMWQSHNCLQAELRSLGDIPVTTFSPSGLLSDLIIDNSSLGSGYSKIVELAFGSVTGFTSTSRRRSSNPVSV